MASLSESKQTTCVVCCHETRVWAVGECNHPTCLLCCARMRVLCDQKDCPVCRLNLKQIVVVSKLSPFQTIPFHDWRYSDRKYNIYFRNRELYEAFRAILDYRCQLCPHQPPLRSFRKLREHASKTHDLHFCDICLDNLKLFPSEFKMYTRSKLATHRREGDADDTSYKGHPNCEFCDERYLDKDTLHMHLRKNHFWCHFCESDGRQDFYPDLHSLRLHFKGDHFLCEEGECRHNVLTSAFRNEIDLKAHCANVHSQGLSKAEVKKMRHLPVEFVVHSTLEEEMGTSKRRTLPIRGGGGVPNHSKETRSTQMSEQEGRDLAMAMSASLQQQDSEQRNKATKRPPPGRKKTLCAQREEEPPPGFGGQGDHKKTQRNAELPPRFGGQGGHKKTQREAEPPPGFGGQAKKKERVQVDRETSRDNCVRDGDKEVAKTNEEVVEKDSWPSLGIPSASPELIKKNNSTSSSSKRKEKSSPPITPPPGYAKTQHPPHNPPQTFAKHKRDDPVSSAFPPLPSGSRSEAMSSASSASSSASASSKAVGGSKIFEEIRQALNYDTAKFKAFQSNSGWFRSGVLTIQEYDAQCTDLFGPRWAEIGPLIAKVMPQGRQREELVNLFAVRGVTVGAPEKLYKKTKKKAKPVSNAWLGGAGDKRGRGGVGGGASGDVKRRVGSRGVSEEEYPSLSVASKLPKSSSNSSVWKVSVHS